MVLIARLLTLNINEDDKYKLITDVGIDLDHYLDVSGKEETLFASKRFTVIFIIEHLKQKGAVS